MKKSLLAVFSFLFICSACSKDEIKTDPDNLLVGLWIYSGFQDNTNIFLRNTEFVDNHCYRFNSDGTLTERKNSGWCGTPPVSYADYSGTWTIINDTLIQINVGYWGGTTSYMLDIEAVDSNSLKTSYVPGEN
jgi:hypothetical protein